LAAKRIFQLAKELGVDSKVMVAKCQAEEIPNITNHMSVVHIGLEATLREWFSGSSDGNVTTTVEATEKVDIAQARAKAPRSRKAKGPDATEDGGPATSTSSEQEALVVKPVTEPKPAPTTVAQAGPITDPTLTKAKPITPTIGTSAVSPTPPRAAPIRPAAAPAEIIPPAAPPTSPAAAPAAPTAQTAPAAPTEPEPPAAPVASPFARSSIAQTRSSISPVSTRVAPPPPPPRIEPTVLRPGTTPPGPPPAPTRVAPASPPAPEAPAEPAATPAVPARPAARVTPAPMNVPSRPQAVTPAGPRLETKTQVRIAGPKVVRVEAPEQVQAPRPRRVGPPGAPGAPRPGEDDRSRSPRRRDTPSPAAAPGKRSSGVGVPERRRGRSDSDWVGSTRGIFSEKDLIEREEKLARSGGFLKKRKQDAANKLAHDHADDGPSEGRLRIAAPFTIKDLSAATGVKASDIVKKLFMQGVMKKINDAIEPEKAIEIMMDFDIDLEVTQAQTAEEVVSSEFERREAKDLRARGPVVTILGHVDHGKTSLLDKIRNTNVAAGEAGGITQKTSAFVVNVEVEGRTREVVFLDTPGHEAFTSMRSRGAKMTDVVVLVVSAPEGVMPQTIESINHAKAAKVPLVVALNKIDRPDATESQVQKTLGQLAAAGLNPAEWGGDTEVIRTSATTGQGIKELLEALDYQSQLLELKADFAGAGQGVVVESKMEEGRGAVASILLQQGLLKVGDFIVMGRSFGRVRDISDDKGRRVKEASPPLPVQISGIDEVCDAGDKFYVVDSLKKAQEAAEQRRQRERHVALAQPRVTLDNIFTQITDKEVKEILVVLKTDQQGTVDVLKGECEKVKGTEVKVRVLHAAVGGITESDVLLADASKAIVIGFNVIPSGKARQLAESKGVEIRTYQVIYDITDDLKKAAEGMLAPELREEVLGHAEVRQVFKISKVGSIAGCYVTDGTVQRDALIRVTRNGVVIEHDRKLAQLKRLKDDAKDVRAGMECGMKIDGYDDIKEGDVLECYKKVEVKRTL
jgi:translation initiation factor IF-2